ncbi:Cyanase [Neolentinus lepideus HHB14362 ss-1]|uniref:Cyanate hydratase n=1 Tax=Neolentinus lepideus HHB14362 ss-1 TaxID=1314782 RepID=A0A165P3R6_9AGAM|nr:Cyanase [Neolentinus lepideus HHB14362 ss-1]
MAQTFKVASTVSPYSELPPICGRFFEAKAAKGLTFDQIGKAIGKDEMWVAAVFYAQAKMSPEDLEGLAKVLDLPAAQIQAELGENWWPNRAGMGEIPPRDPVLYRLFEGVMVYGHAIKAVIHEKFGDGIMSMIDCKVNVTKKPDPKGDRILLTFDGKFLPYAKW